MNYYRASILLYSFLESTSPALSGVQSVLAEFLLPGTFMPMAPGPEAWDQGYPKRRRRQHCLVAEELARCLQPLLPPFQGSRAAEPKQGPDPKTKKCKKGISICLWIFVRLSAAILEIFEFIQQGAVSSDLRLALGWPAGRSKNTGKGAARVRGPKGREGEGGGRVWPQGLNYSTCLTGPKSWLITHVRDLKHTGDSPK